MIKSPFITFFAAVAVVVVALVLTYPAYQQMDQRKTELALEQEKFKEAQEINKKLKELAEQYEVYKAEAEKIAMALPDKKDIPSLLVSLEAISAENGMLLESLGLSIQSDSTSRLAAGQEEAGALGQQFKKLGLDMSLNGSYDSLKNFLAAIEKNLRIIDVEAISFSADKNRGDILEYSIRATAYYR